MCWPFIDICFMFLKRVNRSGTAPAASRASLRGGNSAALAATQHLPPAGVWEMTLPLSRNDLVTSWDNLGVPICGGANWVLVL